MPKIVTKTKLEPKTFDAEEVNDATIPKISVREYMRNFKLYNEKVMQGESFIIAKNNEDQILISPAPKKKYCFADIFNIKKFKGGDPYLSEKVDQIVYGI